jgi:hypothetical protein
MNLVPCLYQVIEDPAAVVGRLDTAEASRDEYGFLPAVPSSRSRG